MIRHIIRRAAVSGREPPRSFLSSSTCDHLAPSATEGFEGQRFHRAFAGDAHHFIGVGFIVEQSGDFGDDRFFRVSRGGKMAEGELIDHAIAAETRNTREQRVAGDLAGHAAVVALQDETVAGYHLGVGFVGHGGKRKHVETAGGPPDFPRAAQSVAIDDGDGESGTGTGDFFRDGDGFGMAAGGHAEFARADEDATAFRSRQIISAPGWFIDGVGGWQFDHA